jgi:hypothetical protein
VQHGRLGNYELEKFSDQWIESQEVRGIALG